MSVSYTHLAAAYADGQRGQTARVQGTDFIEDIEPFFQHPAHVALLHHRNICLLYTSEAQALLAGIMLDTRSFALHVGVRTFEAAAWLRSRGAQTADTKLLFNTSKEEYLSLIHIW